MDQAMLCIPTPEDFQRMKTNENNINIEDIIHTEPLIKCEFPSPLKSVSSEDYIEKLKNTQLSRKIAGIFS